MKKTIAFLGAAAALALGAATPSSVPAWIDINAQIPARTDMSTDTVAFTTSADGRTIDEETGGGRTLTRSTRMAGLVGLAASGIRADAIIGERPIR